MRSKRTRGFMVVMRGSDFRAMNEDGKAIRGFKTARKVAASNDVEAAKKGIEALIEEPHVKRMIEECAKNHADCKIEIEKCSQMSTWSWCFKRHDSSFIYDLEEDPTY